jgi:ribosomal protein S14
VAVSPGRLGNLVEKYPSEQPGKLAMGIRGPLPDHMLSKIELFQRKKHKLGVTYQESQAQQIYKTELEIHNQIWSFLRRNNFEDVEYSNPHRSTRARRGRPDFLICRDGRRLGLEIKVGSNKLSSDQSAFFEMAQRQNNRCVVCYDYQSAVREIKTFFHLSQNE